MALTPTPPAPEPGENMGLPTPRPDGLAKVTGTARYAADYPIAGLAHGFLVTSAIARGSVVGFDDSAAREVPGLIAIYTHENRPPLKAIKHFGAGGPGATSLLPLDGPEILHEGQIVALVVAEREEQAREAAWRLKVAYRREDPVATFQGATVGESRGETLTPFAELSPMHKDIAHGDAAAGLARATHRVVGEYLTPTQHHNPIELFSTTAAWQGDELTLWEPSQWVVGLQHAMAHQLGLEPRQVTVICPFVGGAFGAKAAIAPRTTLVAAVARQIGRPLRVVATRKQGFTDNTFRSETLHHLELGADAEGRLTGYVHDGQELTSRSDTFAVAGNKKSAGLYAFPATRTSVLVQRADRNTPGFMRSPAEVPYVFPLEAAMDELAEAAGMDPIAFRKLNDTDRVPHNGHVYSSRSLMRCYDEAARVFGWETRSLKPRSMQDGDWLIGWGAATAMYPTQHMASAVRLRLSETGRAEVECAAHEIGNGAYAAFANIAAEGLGLKPDQVRVVLGSSTLPPAPVAGGSVTTASVAAALEKAIAELSTRLVTAGAEPRLKPAEAIKAAKLPLVEVYAEWNPNHTPDGLQALHKGEIRIAGGEDANPAMVAYGAELVEVRVHRRTHEIRVPRITGAFAAGRIVNPRTARSQYLGGLIWGISSALHEFTEIDKREARYVNDNIAEYLIPVNADIRRVDILMVPEVDAHVPAGIKGLGELANVGTAAAIASAVWHATGIRIRDLPITADKLILRGSGGSL